MSHLGGIISLAVAFFWTGSALAFEYAGKRVGSLMVNIFRLIIGGLMLGCLLYITSGNMLPVGANAETWMWMLLSGAAGFVLGDLCLFHSYLVITARFSQLIMTITPLVATFFGFIILGERIEPMGMLAMLVTMTGIGLAVFGRGEAEEKKSFLKLKLPTYGVLLAVGGAVGQGLGLVLSKKGMEVYAASIPSTLNVSEYYIPFAATQIRIIAGIVGFALVIYFSRQGYRIRPSLKDRKAMGSIIVGSFCGPFMGVSLSLMAVRYVETGIATTVMALVPVIIIIPAAWMFKQKITAREVAGAIISVLGVAMFFMM